MTPLHWAAYWGDERLVQILVKQGANQTASIHGYTPVDIAGFCGRKRAVKYIADDLALKILKEETMI